MIDKQVASPAEAVADVFDGATVMIGGFGEAGSPIELIHALIDQGATDLTVVNNNTGSGEVGLAALIKAGRVAKMICSYPRTTNSTVFPELYRSGRTEAGARPPGNPGRADPGRRRRHPRLLHAHFGEHATGGGQGETHLRRSGLRARARPHRRLRPDQGARPRTATATWSTT